MITIFRVALQLLRQLADRLAPTHTPGPPMNELPACCYALDSAPLAERMYAAYNAAGDPTTAGLNYQGRPCPTWAELPENIRAKWEGAAGAVAPRDVQLLRGGSVLVERVGGSGDEAPWR